MVSVMPQFPPPSELLADLSRLQHLKPSSCCYVVYVPATKGSASMTVARSVAAMETASSGPTAPRTTTPAGLVESRTIGTMEWETATAVMLG